MSCSRRVFVAGSGALIAALSTSRLARALGRTPVGGHFSLHVPFSLGSIDPHELSDPAAALFAGAISDPVFAFDSAGNAYPALVQGMPVRDGGVTTVKVREGLRTARGVPLDGRDLVFSIERARARGAAAWLGDLPRPATKSGEPLTVTFGSVDPFHVARGLASPLVALLPRRFSPSAPDGTGAFKAEITASGIHFSRNPFAARGNPFLESFDASPAEDLRTSLREFEAERDDVGWLGTGLHDVRRGAQRFDLGRVAVVVLTISGDAGSFGMPGVAQKLVGAISPERIAHLGLGAMPPASGDPGWGGPPCELVVDATAPYLVEISRVVAPILSRPGHEVSAVPVPRAEVARRKSRSQATLALELVRPFSPFASGILPALASLEDPTRAKDLARHPPKFAPQTAPRQLTATLRAGVIGDVRVAGGVVPDLVLAHAPGGDGWDLGASYRKIARK